MADDLMQMQRQAAHRVRQMQEHSRRVFEAHREPPPEPPAPTAPDSERWLILGLALLLHQNRARPELILALLYLAL